MNPYPSTYPQVGYGVQYPPNQFYGPPPVVAQPNGYNGYNNNNGYSATPYQSYRRRPSDPGPRPHRDEPLRQLSRRHRTNRRPSEDEDARPVPRTRPRNNSMRTTITPDHIFISLSSHDILKFSNLPSEALLDDLRQVLTLYWSHGVVALDEGYHFDYSLKLLGGDVWSAGGLHGLEARRLIAAMFTFLAQAGYGYLATVDIGHPMKAPRLVFTSVPADPTPEYFMISFSLNRRTVNILDCPRDLAVLVGNALRGTAPPIPAQAGATHPVENARWVGQRTYEVVTGDRGAARQDLATMMGSVLKLIAAEGYRFEASVPFGKAGFLGLRGRREVWMFRRIGPSPELSASRPRYR